MKLETLIVNDFRSFSILRSSTSMELKLFAIKVYTEKDIIMNFYSSILEEYELFELYETLKVYADVFNIDYFNIINEDDWFTKFDSSLVSSPEEHATIFGWNVIDNICSEYDVIESALIFDEFDIFEEFLIQYLNGNSDVDLLREYFKNWIEARVQLSL